MSNLHRHLNLCKIMLKSMPSQRAATVSSLLQFSCPVCSDGTARSLAMLFKSSLSVMAIHNIFTSLLKSSFNSA